jgi:UDP-2,3-diacylglucosamine pyrophosphatase LpxH
MDETVQEATSDGNSCAESDAGTEYRVKVRSHNVLAFSDVHLGSDLVSHAIPDAPPRSRISIARDRDLSAFLDWYRTHRVGERPWRLVIGGDFIDFSGMSVMAPHDELATAPTEEELAHGLGGAADHSLTKLRLVMAHHASVMKSLADFVAAGNQLVIVRGNHDIDWHWECVQTEFVKGMQALSNVPDGAVEFAPWFYYEEGVLYLEHGHQYDSYCSHEHVLYPVAPGDPKRMALSLSDVLIRYIVRPTRGMMEGGHEKHGVLDYVRFAFSLGARGTFRLLSRFIEANRALFALWRAHVGRMAKRSRREQQRRMRRLAVAYRINLKRLRALVRLQRKPATASLSAIATSLMLDRLALGTLAIVAFVTLFAFHEHWTLLVPVMLALGAVLAVCRHVWFARHTPEPSAELRERSARVARLFPAAFIVMGHTHLPEMKTTASATYVNLGAWAEEEAPDGSPGALPATRTHLVVTCDDEEPIAELRVWDASGPRPFRAKDA